MSTLKVDQIKNIVESSVVDVSDIASKNAFSADTGASLVGFKANGVGAVASTVQNKLRESVSVKDFGAVGDGVTDDTAAIQAAIDYAVSVGYKLRANGTFYIGSTINFRNACVDFTSAVLVLGNASQPIIIGGSSATTINPMQNFKRVYRSGGATTTPTLRVAGTKNQTFSIDACDYLQLYADTAAPNSATNGSIAYCTFNLGKIDKLELTNNPLNIGVGAGDGGSIQWINENRFNLQRCTNFVMSGTYEHNHNFVVGGSFESTSTITLTNGWDNHFYDIRFEGTPTVTFGATTERNVIVNTWDSSTSNSASSGATVNDSGFDNIVVDDFFLYRQSQMCAYTDVADVFINTQTAPNVIRSGDLQRIYTSSISSSLVESDYIPVSSGDYFRWVSVFSDGSITSTSARYRPRIEFFDRQLRSVTATADFILTTGGVLSTVSGNSISAGTNVNGAVAVIKPAALTAGVQFVKVIWRGNSPSTTSISQAIQLYISQYTVKRDTFKGAADTGINKVGVGVLVSGIPTQSFAPMGYTAIKSDATAKYVNLFSHETTTTATYNVGATIIAISSGAGTSNGDIVGINLDDLSTHWTTIVSGGGTTSITLAGAIPSTSTMNSRIVFNRWVAY